MSSHDRLVPGVRKAFLDYGYDQLTMSGIAKVCGLTRRALYHHFSNKEEAFRFLLAHSNEVAIRDGMAAGRAMLAEGGDPVAVFATILDVRYGENRRRLALSPHAVEINDQAFRRARDLMVEAATTFQAELAELIAEMVERGLFRLRPTTTPADLAQMLADGARGVNQTLPPIPTSELPVRYRRMCEAILYGSVDRADMPAAPSEARGGGRRRAAKGGT